MDIILDSPHFIARLSRISWQSFYNLRPFGEINWMLGVISNSHGRADAVAAAVEVFAASAVESIVHCGDVGGRHVLDVIGRIGGVFVWGDRDHDRTGLMRYSY